jgi:hypothetical protein
LNKVIRMKVAELILDYNLYPRQRVDSYHVSEMVESLKAGANFPPVVAESASKRVVDGFHRCAALQRIYKEKAEVDVILKKYASEALMYEDAMRLNSTHGRNLTSYDKAHCILKGRELGLHDAVIADALHITTDRIGSLIEERWTADEHVVKATMSHMAGKTLNKKQREFIPKAGGMDQLFYINQVLALLETNLIDWSREKVIETLNRLYEVLGKRLKVLAK